jgi:ABC-type antimicrobial peptide transport system permease subunit
VVNKAFADYYFAGQNPIGRRITFDQESDKDDLEIVGVIGDVKNDSAREKAERTVYQPIFQIQDQQTYNNTLELRTAGDPLGLAAEVRAAVTQVDDKLPILNLTSLRIQTDESLRQERLLAQLVSFFGLLGLALSCVGLYGIMAHAVVRRTNEIGIRMALGAERRDIVWMVLKESMLLVSAGLIIGVPAAWGAAHLISSQLFGLNPGDPVTLSLAVVLLTLVGALAGYLPARKASRVDPLVELRYE